MDIICMVENISGQLSVAEIGGNDDADCGGYDDPLANAMMAFDAVVVSILYLFTHSISISFLLSYNSKHWNNFLIVIYFNPSKFIKTNSIVLNLIAWINCVRKYDPSVQLDRGQVDTSSLLSSSGSGFPEQYITSLGGRTLLVAKGSGLKEKMERVKAIGYTGGSGGFHGVKGPQLQKLRLVCPNNNYALIVT